MRCDPYVPGRRVEYPLKRVISRSEEEAFSAESFRIKKANGILPSPRSSALITMDKGYVGTFDAFSALEFYFLCSPRN